MPLRAHTALIHFLAEENDHRPAFVLRDHTPHANARFPLAPSEDQSEMAHRANVWQT